MAIASAVLVVVLLWRWSPLWPGPGLPPHATRLHLLTEPLHLMLALGCPTAALGPVRVATAGEDLVVVSPESGTPVRVVWPAGWAAWRLAGRAEMVDRWGGIVGREGDILARRFGGGEQSDGTFHICEIGW
jgi:hypothetical protein